MKTTRTSRILLALACAAAFTVAGCRDADRQDDMTAGGVDDRAATPAPAEPSSATTPPETTSPTTTDTAAADANADQSFVRAALASGLAEVSISRHIEAQSPTKDVRALAKRIADDHEALNDKLRTFAGMQADAIEPDASAKAMDTMIRSSKGTDLDRAYLQHMADGHAKSIARYETAAASAQDDGVRSLASSALPKLREHAQAVAAQLGKSN